MLGTNSEYFPVEQELINLSSAQGLRFLWSKKWQLSQLHQISVVIQNFKYKNLRFVVPCVFIHSNKTNQLDATNIRKFIAFLYRYCSTCFGHYNAHNQEPVKLPLQPLVSVWMWRWKCSQPWSATAENTSTSTFIRKQRLQRQFDGLLVMGIVMPETCWAVSVQKGDKLTNVCCI
jgi:hypothetical protein